MSGEESGHEGKISQAYLLTWDIIYTPTRDFTPVVTDEWP